MSLADSADHSHYRLVALAVPVIDNAHGDTHELRAKLGLPTEPDLKHVVDHMLKMAAAGHLKAMSQQTSNPLTGLLLEDIKQAYQYIVHHVRQSLASGGSLLETLKPRLAEGCWVLVSDYKFVRPSELCFDLEEDKNHGKHCKQVLSAHASCGATFACELIRGL